MYYSANTGGFYDSAIHGENIPVDVVEITSDEHALLMQGQSEGKRIIANGNGFPVLSDRGADQAPHCVTMRQARLALLQSGKLAQVNAAVAAMSGAQGDAARIEWEFSSTVERGRPLTQAMIASLGMTEAEADDLFTLAASM